MNRAQVILVSMPFDYLYRPSLTLSLLKAALRSKGIRTSVLYKTLSFAERIGAFTYARMANEDPRRLTLVGEWLFAGALSGNGVLDSHAFENEFLRGNYPEAFIQDVLRARGEVAEFLVDCVKEVVSLSPSVVAFATLSDPITRHTVSSLALARVLKERMPGICTVIGGPNWDPEMALEAIGRFPFLDAVIAGEMDEVFPKLVQRVLDSEPFSEIPGVYQQSRTSPIIPETIPVRDLNSLPVPDYEDYFSQLQSSNLDHYDPPRIVFETSRGCWWGEKHPCTFCGLNGNSIAYRGKSPERALEELIALAQRYPDASISAADWILDMKYFQTLLPELARLGLNLDLFYEVKSNLNKNQLRILRDAGVVSLQPGIESFSDRILKAVNKGVRGLQNIQLLKWCKELGIQPSWLLLWGFPGEPEDEYRKMAEWVPWLTHLAPPAYCGSIHLDRFSPYHRHPERYGLRNVKPFPAYRYIYPLPEESIAHLAGFFSFEYEREQDPAMYTQDLAHQVGIWEEAHEQSDLFCVAQEEQLLVWDLRPAARARLSILSGMEKQLYEFCDRVQTIGELQDTCHLSPFAIREKLASMKELGLLLQDGESFLALAVADGDYVPRKALLERIQTESALIHHPKCFAPALD